MSRLNRWRGGRRADLTLHVIQVPLESVHAADVFCAVDDVVGQPARPPRRLIRSHPSVHYPTVASGLDTVLTTRYDPAGQPIPSLAFLALATLSSFYPLLLLPLLILLVLHPDRSPDDTTEPPPPSTSAALRLSGAYAAILGCLLAGERVWLGGWEGVVKGTRMILTISDLTPNVGLSWYFFTEMFDHFRPFFTMVFQVRLRISLRPSVHPNLMSVSLVFFSRRCTSPSTSSLSASPSGTSLDQSHCTWSFGSPMLT